MRVEQYKDSKETDGLEPVSPTFLALDTVNDALHNSTMHCGFYRMKKSG